MQPHSPEMPGLRRGALAERTGCNFETIRYYEKIGLLPAPPRAANGYRVYDATYERRLRFILRGRRLGFDLDEIRGLLLLDDRGGGTCADVKARTDRHLADIHAKIAELERMVEVLARTAALCSSRAVPDCPIIEELFGQDAEAGRGEGRSPRKTEPAKNFSRRCRPSGAGPNQRLTRRRCSRPRE